MGERRSALSSWLVPTLVVIVAAALVASIVIFAGGDDSETADKADSTSAFPYDIGIESRDADDPLGMGRVDAPITMVVFSDYQCPYCAKWTRDTLPAMLKRVKDGDLRIEMRDISVFGDPSRRAAEASYAAALQDRHLDYHNALFADGDKRSADELSEDALVRLAGSLGLDADRFRADMTSQATAAAVDRSEELAARVGAYSTPSFILGGQPIAGAGPSDLYLDKLDAMLPAGGK
ncbi:DsbA family protein [Gordonia shandongensis]|uniref:DsbA family protein n=1 Tax=Gordonia shandongensis TaxID=376351 RepID=UPI0004119A9D|nr:thioredoxin domain-containing protein [Gordonia shandongensis]